MTSKSKAKGNAFEREIVARATKSGLPAERAWGSNGMSLGLDPEVDCLVAGLKVQAKRRRRIPQWLAIPDACDLTVIREDHGQPLALVSFDYLCNLLRRETDRGV